MRRDAGGAVPAMIVLYVIAGWAALAVVLTLLLYFICSLHSYRDQQRSKS